MDSIADTFPYFAVYAGCASLLVAVLLVLTKQWHGKLTMDSSVGVQKVHLAPTPRVGGIAIVAGVLVGYVGAPADAQALLLPLIVAGVPAFGFGLLEDITKKVGVRTRLLATMACGVLGWAMTGASLTQVGVPGLDWLLTFTLISILFTAFAVGGVANAINIIDGFNGLAAGSAIIIFLAFSAIGHALGDTQIALVCLVLSAGVSGFLLLNWPFGKLFLGDGGAYFVGFSIAWIAVLLVSRHPGLSPWAPLLVCGYPVLEVIFSIARRRRRGLSPGDPDRLHLHSLVKRRLVRRILPNTNRLLRNSATGALMWTVAAVPAVFAAFWLHNTPVLLASLVLSVAAYSLFYARLANFRWGRSYRAQRRANVKTITVDAKTPHAPQRAGSSEGIKISVITATWNCVRTVGDALDSLDAQSHRNIEQIWIDGQSTDGTTELLQSRLGNAKATLVSEPDDGIYDALNKGLLRATGDVVGFLHADDMLADSAVLSQVAKAFEDPTVDAVYGDLEYVRKDSPNLVVRHWKAGRFAPNKLKRGWMPPHPTLYLRRSLLEHVGAFDSNLRIAADYDHILRIFNRAAIRSVYLDRVLVRMRVGGASNRSLKNILRKSSEDLEVLRRNRVGGLHTLAAKNLSKIGQFRTGGGFNVGVLSPQRLLQWATQSLFPAKKEPESDG